jgi:transposase-like protein
MEYGNINISNIEDIIEQTVKEQIEKLMKLEQDIYLEENPGIKNGHYKRNLKTKYGELKELKVPRNRDNKFHSAVIEYNKTIGLEELITSLYSNGVSTRKISEILRDVFNNKYSPSSISKITDIALEEVNKFLNRKLDKRYIAVMLDDYSST